MNNKSTFIQETIGVYPATSIGVSFYYYNDLSVIICRKDGITSKIFSEEPYLNIVNDNFHYKIDISGRFFNGMLDAINKKMLPSVIIATPCYEFLNDLIDDLTMLSCCLMELEQLRPVSRLQLFNFPTIILASNGIIYDEVINNLAISLQKAGIPEKILSNICSKIIRASVMQAAYRENNVYYTHKKGFIKIAVPKFALFSQVVELLNAKGLIFSVYTNPYKVEFEKAIVNIATNAVAIVFALDKKNQVLNKIDLQNALSPMDTTQATFVKELQEAIFTIGQKTGAFSQSETFEKIWLPRKDQILKNDGTHISSSLRLFARMIKENNIPDKLPSAEQSLIKPLKAYARHYQMTKELALLQELEQMIISNVTFVRKFSKDVEVTF